MAFDYPPTIYKVARASIVKLGQSLELEISNHPVMSSTGADILDLYQVLSSRQEIQLTQEFFNGGLQSIIKDRYHLIFKEDLEKEAFLQDLVNFIAGVIATFKIMVLKKGAWHELA